ncbi:MAG: autotransporter domain-containing protein [Nitrospinales bacterium]
MPILDRVKFQTSAISALALVILLVCASFSFATPFDITGLSEDDGHTLDGNETGTVQRSGEIRDNRGVSMDGSDNNTLNNFGFINADSDEGVRIRDDNGGNTVNNYGVIQSDDDEGVKIEDNSDGNTVNNYGSIISNDRDGIHIHDGSDDNTINNYGSIKADGDGVEVKSSDNNTINNHGDISTDDDQGDGVLFEDADGNTLNNYGNSIHATGDGVEINSGDNNVVNNYGLINSSNKDGIRIEGDSDGNTINNYGKIFVDDNDNDAINSQGSNNNFNFFSRSQIIGKLRLDGDAGDVVNLHFDKAGTSSTLTFDDERSLPTLNLHNDNMMQRGDEFAIVVDPTGPSVQAEALGTLTDKIHGAISNHLLNGPPGNPQLASLSVQDGMVKPGKGDQFWVSAIGLNRERDEDGRALAYNHDIAGGVAGYETSIGNFRVGGLAGYAHADVVTDTVSSDTNTSSWFIGGYGRASFGIINLDVALLAGYEKNDHDRWLVDNLNGFEIAHGNFDSYFLSPSATVSSQFNIMDNISLRPSVTATYSAGFYNSYTERGSTQSNLSIDNRTAHAFITTFRLDTAYTFSPGNEVAFRVGGRYRYTDDGNINASLAGSSFQYAAVGDDENLEGLFGATVRLGIKDRVSLTADMEHSLNGIENTLVGQLGLEFTF